MKYLKSNQLPFWILAITVVSALILPFVVQDGMFMDGVLYASVSHNLAQGIGTMWFLKFSDLGFADFTTFHEHPPLIFWIQAIFFKVFGSSIYVERFYSFFTAIVAAWLIYKNWKIINYKNSALSKMAWLAVIFWIMIPVAFWSFRNNVQENTMSIFSLLSVYFVLKALHLNKKLYLNLFLTGVMIFAASFAKGVPGFFPLAIVPVYWLFFRSFSFLKMVYYSLIVTLSCALIYGLILLIPDARDSLSIYVFERLLGRVDSKPTVDSHFYIMIRLFMELLPLLVIVFIFHIVYRIKKIKHHLDKEKFKIIGFFMLIGICGSLPIMLTLVQKTFYMGASLPFFGIAIAMLVAPGFAEKASKIDRNKKSFKIFTSLMSLAFIVVIVVTIMQKDKVSRNKDTLVDVYRVGATVPSHTTINAYPSSDAWDMQVYLIRYFNISMDKTHTEMREFYLLEKSVPFEIDSSYSKLNLETKKYDLYQLAGN